MMANGLSAAKAAKSLGMTRRSIINYRTGARPVPRYVALACKGWEVEQGLTPK
jgi:predicted transcriptional regulator